jgi:hypothetical protein
MVKETPAQARKLRYILYTSMLKWKHKYWYIQVDRLTTTLFFTQSREHHNLQVTFWTSLESIWMVLCDREILCGHANLSQ